LGGTTGFYEKIHCIDWSGRGRLRIETLPTTYWTEKNGVATVHHVTGNVDHTEKLSTKPLTKDAVASDKLGKGSYFQVVTSEGVFTPAKPLASPTPKKTDKDDAKLVKLGDEVRDLKAQVKALQARPEPTPAQEVASEAPAPDAPRMS
jgi:hypothetical protein